MVDLDGSVEEMLMYFSTYSKVWIFFSFHSMFTFLRTVLLSWASVLKCGTQFSSLQKPKQKPDTVLGEKIQILLYFDERFFHRTTFISITFL